VEKFPSINNIIRQGEIIYLNEYEKEVYFLGINIAV